MRERKEEKTEYKNERRAILNEIKITLKKERKKKEGKKE
jgi:hypothetical protein